MRIIRERGKPLTEIKKLKLKNRIIQNKSNNLQKCGRPKFIPKPLPYINSCIIINIYTKHEKTIKNKTKVKKKFMTSSYKSILSIVSGFKKDKNVKYEIYNSREPYKPCHVLLTYAFHGYYNKKNKLYNYHAGPILVIERGYIARSQYYMVGINGLNGRAEFNNQNSPSDRWKKLEVKLQSWRKDGKHILVCGQCDKDASLSHWKPQSLNRKYVYRKLIRNIINQIIQHTSRKIIYRPHPQCYHPINFNKYKKRYPNVIISKQKNRYKLYKDLENCWCVVTYNSNSAVEALIAGIPVITLDQGSMVYDITGHDLSQIENPLMYDRVQQMCDIAYTQWTIDEMKQGLPWQHLKPLTINNLQCS